MRPHENLDLWKKAIEFVVSIYKVTETFPKEEKFGLTSQLRRAAVSIVANISEGAARRSGKEFRQFLSHSQGSASEVDAELVISYRLTYLTQNDFQRLAEDLDHMPNDHQTVAKSECKITTENAQRFTIHDSRLTIHD